MNWQEAFKCSTINHRAPYLSFIAWALNVDVKTIAEIGVNRAETSKLFRTLFPDAHLYLIDPWQLTQEYLHSATPISRKLKHYEKAYSLVRAQFQNDPQATILRMTSIEAIHHTPEQFDLVFIDANHEYLNVKQDILAWLSKVRRGGSSPATITPPKFRCSPASNKPSMKFSAQKLCLEKTACGFTSASSIVSSFKKGESMQFLMLLIAIAINLTTWAAPYRILPVTFIQSNDIPPRLQWNHNSGYCGEVSLISAGLYYGQYISQYDTRAIATQGAPQNKDQLLLGINDQYAATQMRLKFHPKIARKTTTQQFRRVG